MHLSKRDYQILATLYLLRICSVSQLNSLYFSSIVSTRRRLWKLQEIKYVRIKSYVDSSNKRFNVYCLAPKGVYIARVWLESIYDRVFPDRFHKALYSRMYEHELLMVEVFTKLVRENVLNVENLFSGIFLDSRLAPVLPNILNSKRPLKPDARFLLNDVMYWIEVDRSTETEKMIEKKMLRYQAYFAANPGQQHTVLFLMGGNINWKNFHQYRALSCEHIGPLNSNGSVKWYTLTFSDLDFIVKYLLAPNFFTSCINKIMTIGCYKSSMKCVDHIFSYKFLKTSVPAAWVGFKDMITNYMQFYVVESIVGGESGALERLKYFVEQSRDFYNVYKGRGIKLIVLISDQNELKVLSKLYPKLINDLIVITVPELLNGQCKVLIARDGS